MLKVVEKYLDQYESFCVRGKMPCKARPFGMVFYRLF